MRIEVKKVLSRIMSVVMLLSMLGIQPMTAQAATYPLADVTYTATATAGELVSFFMLTGDADPDNFTADQIIKTDIVAADSTGAATFNVVLTNVEIDDLGNITNYQFKTSATDYTVSVKAVAAPEEDSYVTCTATAAAGELVSFIVLTADADPDNFTADQIVKTDIVTADSTGVATFKVTLTGKLSDYQFKSSGAALTVTSSNMADLVIPSDYVQVEYGTNNGTMGWAIPVVIDDVVFVPISDTFKFFGLYDVNVSYDNTQTDPTTGEVIRIYTGTHNNGDFEIIVGNDYVTIDLVDVELPAASRYYANGNFWSANMIPLYIFEDLFKIDPPIYDPETKTVWMQDPGVYTPSADADVLANVAGYTGTTMTTITAKMSNGTPTAGTLSNSYSNGVLTITCAADEYGMCDGGYVSKGVSGGAYAIGDVGLISFEAQTTDNSEVTLAVIYQRTTDWHKAAQKHIIVTPELKRYYVPVYSTADAITTSNSQLAFKVTEPTTMQISNFSFVNYGTQIPLEYVKPEAADGYKGHAADALWRKEAYRRIEKYRKDDLTVRVQDANGTPIENALITVNQTESEFLFGGAQVKSEVVDLDTSTTSGQILDNYLNNSINTGVAGLEMKTSYMVHDDGATGIQMANEYFSRGLRMRGHALWWDYVGSSVGSIENYMNMNYQELYDAAMDIIRSEVYTFKGKVVQWDCLNEPTDRYWMQTNYQTTRFYSDIFKEAKRIDPDAKMYINETGIEGKDEDTVDRIPTLVKLVKNMKREGAPVDGIGVQTHLKNYYYPQGFYLQLNDLAELVDELTITEYDFAQEGHEYSVDYMKDILIATYSHPRTKGFINWGVQDDNHEDKNASFYNSDWTEKPALQMWNDTVNTEFKTNAEVYTDENGEAVIRGFHGDYTVTCLTPRAGKTSTKFKLVDIDAVGGTNEILFKETGSGTALRASSVSNLPDAQIEPITYVDASDSMEDYYNEFGVDYSTVYLDTRFSGLEYNDNVLNGTGATGVGEDFNNAKRWASNNGGLVGLVAGGDQTSLTLRQTQNKWANLYHVVSVTDYYPDADFYTELMFDTLAPDAAANYGIELFYDTSGKTKIGGIAYNSTEKKYYIETRNGTVDERINLNPNTQYNLKISDLADGSGLRYVLTDVDDNVLASYTRAGEAIDTSNITRVMLRLSSSGTSGEDIFKLHAIRVGAEKNDEIINFSSTDYQKVLLDEDMAYFDLSNDVQYLGSTISEENLSMLEGNKWGLYGDNSTTVPYGYGNRGKYLYAVRRNSGNPRNLVKPIEPIKSGETLKMSFETYLHVSTPWANTPGYAVLSLGNATKGLTLDVMKMAYSNWAEIYGMYALSKNDSAPSINADTADDGRYISYTKINVTTRPGSLFKNVNLNVEMTLAPNASDSTYYDASIYIWNNDLLESEADPNKVGEPISVTYEKIMTAEEVETLEAVYFASQATSSVSITDLPVMGIRNMKITQEGTAMEADTTDSSVKIYAGKRNHIAVPYDNVTGAARTARITVAAYDSNGTLLEKATNSCFIKKGEGEIPVDVSGLAATENVDHYKVYLWESFKTLKPYKDTDKLIPNLSVQ